MISGKKRGEGKSEEVGQRRSRRGNTGIVNFEKSQREMEIKFKEIKEKKEVREKKESELMKDEWWTAGMVCDENIDRQSIIFSQGDDE